MAVYSWSLTASSNATADASINWQEGQNPSTVNDSARAMMAAVKAGFNDIAGVSALGGSGNTFTLSLSQALPSLTNAVVGFFATRSNTGAVTLNVDSTGAKPLRMTSGVALASGEIVSGQFYICAYNTSNQEWIIVGTGAIPNSRLATMADGTVKGNLSGSTGAPSDVTLASLADAIAAAGYAFAKTGTIFEWGGTIASIPSGYLFCDGSAVSRTTYAALFAAIGTRHGAGDGSTTFNLPDKTNIFTIGADADDSGVPKTNVTGSYTTSGGSKDAVNVSHTHTASVTDPGHTHNAGASVTVNTGSTANVRSTATTTTATGSATTGITVGISTEGSSGTNANLPPYGVGVFMIKT